MWTNGTKIAGGAEAASTESGAVSLKLSRYSIGASASVYIFCVPQHYYPAWVSNRCDFIINHFGEPFFKGKSILELGSFESDIGARFAALGANVTCYEGRQANIDEALARYSFPNMQVIRYDIEDLVLQIHYDIILNMGILYHLKNVDNCIEQCVKHCDYCVLESEVLDNAEKAVCIPKGDLDYMDQSCSESREVMLVSEAYLEKAFDKYAVAYTKHNDARLNGNWHDYTWRNLNDSRHRAQRRRFYIIQTRAQPH